MNSQFLPLQSKLILAFCGVLVFAAGCEPEMPVPPPREAKNPAEDAFLWAMERMEHAIERFQPSSSLGLSVKRKLDFELIPPSDKKSDYRARVTIATKTVYRPDAPATAKERKETAAQKAREANRLKLDNPYTLPGEGSLGGNELTPSDIPPAELPTLDIPDPRMRTQRIDEKHVYMLEYLDGEWKLESAELEEHERMWFDYALEQGDFSPKSGS